MPDFTHHAYWQCVTVESFSTEVQGRFGRYTVSIEQHGETTDNSYRCTCPDFKYSKPYKDGQQTYKPACKHIKGVELRKVRCGWLQFFDGDKVVTEIAEDGREIYKCPKCEKEAVARMWAV